MITRCVAVVLVTAGCAWGLSGCNRGPKPDEKYKQNAEAVVKALDVVKADVEQKVPLPKLNTDYAAAQAARKTWDAACTPDQKELPSYKALYYALTGYGNIARNGYKADPHTPDPVGPASKALEAGKKFLEEGK